MTITTIELTGREIAEFQSLRLRLGEEPCPYQDRDKAFVVYCLIEDMIRDIYPRNEKYYLALDHTKTETLKDLRDTLNNMREDTTVLDGIIRKCNKGHKHEENITFRIE